MKIDFKKIINIKNKSDLKDFDIMEPIFQNNYLFHYLIYLNNFDALKLNEFPVFKENEDDLNGFHMAAKYSNLEILCYLIETYPDYIYNRNNHNETFADYVEYEQFSILISKYPKIMWDELITKKIFHGIVSSLSYNELKKFLDIYDIKPTTKNQYLIGILKNKMKTEDKIKLLEKYSDEELNIKNELGEGLIFVPILEDDMKLFDYLIKRKVDIDYYSWMHTFNPLRKALSHDIMLNIYSMSKKLIGIIDIQRQYEILDKYLENIGHFVLNSRISYLQTVHDMNINYDPDMMILNHMTDMNWNQMNVEKITPLELISELDYKIFSEILIKNKVLISPAVLEKLDKTKTNILWLKLFKSLGIYKEKKDDIILDENKYSHSTLFQSTFKDVGIFSIYMTDNYPNLYLPNMESYMVKNLTFSDTFPFSDSIIEKEPVFPWTICYYSQYEYYIHPYLNNLINAERRKGDKRFAVVFLSIIYDKILHANILIYDFKKLTVERFEPYGNSSAVDTEMDDVLEEELTWSTGLKYIRPSDYLPVAGFQTISDENNLENQKAGDFGGFCLAWCLWYLENRIKNPDVEPNILVEKIINKLAKMDIKFSEHIRNYSNKINEKRVKLMSSIGIDSKEISNTHHVYETSNTIANYLIDTFSGKK